MKKVEEVICLVDQCSPLTPPSVFILSPDNTDEDNEAWLRKVLPDLPEDEKRCRAVIECLLEAERALIARRPSPVSGVLRYMFDIYRVKLTFGEQIQEDWVFGEGRDRDAVLNQIYAHCEAVNLDPGNASWEEILLVLEALDMDWVRRLVCIKAN